MNQDSLIKRTIPISSNSSSQLSGLWFPTGYYGQTMSKNRLDIENTFREQARPTPPNKFENLFTFHLSKTSHPFSSHDNRNLFQNDGCYFGKDKNVGKKFINGRSHSAHGNILLWRNNNNEVRVYKGTNLLPNISKGMTENSITNSNSNTSYQNSFCRDNSIINHNYFPPHQLADIPIMLSTYNRSYSRRDVLPRMSRYAVK